MQIGKARAAIPSARPGPPMSSRVHLLGGGDDCLLTAETERKGGGGL